MLRYQLARAAWPTIDESYLSFLMAGLLLRNIATSTYTFYDPEHARAASIAGCVVASPSAPENLPGTDQDYVYNWTRDAALVIQEIEQSEHLASLAQTGQTLNDYVAFAAACQRSAQAADQPIAKAAYLIDATVREWSVQNDGPALQTLAILRLIPKLDAGTLSTALAVVGTNLAYLLDDDRYREPTYTLWEDQCGYSLFARAVELQCFREVDATATVPTPAGLLDAVTWLEGALDRHWDADHEMFVSLLNPDIPGRQDDVSAEYSPNVDVVLAALHGALPMTDSRLLSSAAKLRDAFTRPDRPSYFPINTSDDAQGLGPMIGRYPGDRYDGDTVEQPNEGHPWALCTTSYARLYYELAESVQAGNGPEVDALNRRFFQQVGVDDLTPRQDVAPALIDAGDRMVRAVLHHSDRLELSEQFDRHTGYAKSVSNLSWSYSSLLGALRARSRAGTGAEAATTPRSIPA